MDTQEVSTGWCVLCFSPQYSSLTTNMVATCSLCGHIYCIRCLYEPHKMRLGCPGSDHEAPRYEALLEMFGDALRAPETVNVTSGMWKAIKYSGDYGGKEMKRKEWLLIILKEFGTTWEGFSVDERLRVARKNEKDMKEFYVPLIENIWGGKG